MFFFCLALFNCCKPPWVALYGNCINSPIQVKFDFIWLYNFNILYMIANNPVVTLVQPLKTTAIKWALSSYDGFSQVKTSPQSCFFLNKRITLTINVKHWWWLIHWRKLVCLPRDGVNSHGNILEIPDYLQWLTAAYTGTVQGSVENRGEPKKREVSG